MNFLCVCVCVCVCSCSQCVSDQCQLLDRLPSLCLEELLSYSSSLSSFYHLNHTYTPSPEHLHNLHPSPSNLPQPEPSERKPEAMTGNQPISSQNDTDPAQPPQDWLTQAESPLLDLCDISSDVIFASSRGVVYSGPAFRCQAFDLPDHLQHETHLSLFPVELLTHTLSRMRTLFLDHLELHVQDVLSSAVATVTDRKEVVRLEQELQLKQLNPQYIQTHIYQTRLAELQIHRQRVDDHCEEVLNVLTSCRVELQELQASISRKNQEFTVLLSNMEHNVLTADSRKCVEAVSSTLQDYLDRHIKETQSCETAFRQTVQTRLRGVRDRTTQLLNSFRLFSEGGDFAPREVKSFQRRLREETKQISVTEESIQSELEVFESRSLQQVREASGRFEEKLSSLKSELNFTEEIQRVISSTQVHIKAEAASSNHQQSTIDSRLEDLRRTMDSSQVCPQQVCSVLSSVSEELLKRCQYLDFSLERRTAHPKPRKQVRSAPPPGLLQPSRTSVDLLCDPMVGVIKSLNRVCVIQDAAPEADERGQTAAGQGPVQHPHQRRPESVTAVRGCRSIRTERRFQAFGAEPEPEENTHSFSSTVRSLLWKANDVLLSVAEDFYRGERSGPGRFLLLPDTLDQWAESMQQRLLGYQEQARTFLSTSREELVNQLSVLDELRRLLPAVLISSHERQQEAELRVEVGGVRLKLEEKLAASEKEKRENVRQLRASLRDDELHALNSREELRQQQLHGTICCAHLELQECVRIRGEKLQTSLASLTQNLFYQLGSLLTPAETEAVTSPQHSGDSTFTTETDAGQKPHPVSRISSGISDFLPSTDSTADQSSSVTTATAASITMTRCTPGQLAVLEQRDAAVKRSEQLFRSELSQSHDDKQRRLRELQSWNTHWRQQIHTLTHTTLK
uniref:coiled-coil domain-containing protein 180-like n=1 Tax=Scatophagus argus TaxID=75038 RepID=UPI001ED85D3F|nr:coiled-coil domain-containing protein 180-like [Scatophagus argus]